MIEWISETFSLLFSGATQLIMAVLRLGLAFVALAITWAYIKAVLKDPVVMIRGTLAVIAGLVIGFGSILYVPKHLPLPIIVVWIGGWIVAYYVSVFIGGWSDEKKPNKSNHEDAQ
mgnify:FL=1|jgi:hypothetical protein